MKLLPQFILCRRVTIPRVGTRFKYRCVFFMACFSLSHLVASAQLLDFSGKNVPLATVLKAVEDKTVLNVLYNQGMLAKTHPVTIHVKAKPIEQLLDMAFKDQPIDYKLTEKRLVLVEKMPNNQSSSVRSSRGTSSVQEDKVQGWVSDAKGNRLDGVTVLNERNQVATRTNSDGFFEISGHVGDMLSIRLLGYGRQRVRVQKITGTSIVMIVDEAELDEVIVTGYATQKKREITGSIASISAEDIESANAVTLDQAMQGRMSGVNVQSRVGVPGAAIKVEVRGPGSISAGTEPIYIVDGMIVDNNNMSTLVSANPLANINPDDIESIEVLKDAAAASVYGAQAANGVVLITTKKGKAGKVKVDLGYRTGITTPIRLLDLMNSQEYLNARFEAFKNYNPTWTGQQAWESVFSQSRFPSTTTLDEIAAMPTYDWQKAAYTDGTSNKYDLALSGGSDRSSYRISGSWEDTEGSIVGSDFTRGTMNLNYGNKITDRIEILSTVNIASVNQHGPLGATGTTTQFSAPSYANPMILPFIPIYNEDGSYNFSLSGFPGTFTRHTLHSTELNEALEKNNSLFGNLQLNYKILNNLTYKGLVGLDYRDITARMYYDPRAIDGNARDGILIEYYDKPKTFTTSHVLHYTPRLPDGHTLNTLAGIEYRTYENQTGNVRGEGFPNHMFKQLASAATIVSGTGSWTGVKRLGSFVQTNYTFNSKYMLSAILRYDGSSRFGANNKFGLFPAISAGWDIAREDFIKNKTLINQLKLRIGYGETGNDQIDNFASRSLYGGGVTYDGEAGIQANSMGNSRLRWERNATTNVGIDYTLFSSRIFGSIEAYHRISKDLLLSKPIVWAAGYSEITENLGEVKNQGLEFELGAHLLRARDFKWTSNFNISFQRNKVTHLYDNLTVLPGDNTVRVGYSLRTFVLPQYAGVYSATGRPVWYDAEGNLTYTPGTMEIGDYAPHGLPNELPDFYGGWTNTFDYKGVSLSMFFQYDYGRVFYDNFARNLSRKGDSQINGMAWYYDNRWTTEGQITSVPRPVNGAAERGGHARGDLASTRYLQDASYIRLKNINLSYKLPASWLSTVKMSSAKLYLQANNLYTITKFAGYDPEFYVTGSNTTSNVGVIPAMKSYFLGVQVGF
ncbi:SusC/RagA family TonB-linked outer membrane protein [Sphingobacterium sp. SGG-5]|uniref:SusC/RagA family TonB-linked outer membrane protein n=1 Tax=Sphingobacterium sp. SGG-5 TaxID=2710881 RepID=UPI0013EBEF19|nr:SusC/RagA family TonB-linked outer membrane protein [Sphingobacterium sp. SGG-5]NGM63374.1 SusC/RagA family TonB-linked outer membrane protein [Sphingobacterium sp. SGG-5]